MHCEQVVYTLYPKWPAKSLSTPLYCVEDMLTWGLWFSDSWFAEQIGHRQVFRKCARHGFKSPHNTCPFYFAHPSRGDRSCKYSLFFASWSSDTREWLKSKDASMASLSRTCKKMWVKLILDNNAPMWIDKPRHFIERNTCVWNHKGGLRIHIVKHTQWCGDSAGNRLWPQLMISRIPIP